MKIKLPAIIWVTAIVLAICSAFYSVFGLSKLFSGAVIAVIVVASVLEISKIIVTTYLHDYWKKSALFLKSYLVFALVCLMLITSLGVYGFLTSAYQDTIKDFKIKENEISKIDVKIEAFSKQLDFFRKNESDIQKRLESAQQLKSNQDRTVSTIYSSTANKNTKLLEKSMKVTDELFNKASAQLAEAQIKITAVNDSINFYQMQKLQLQTENQISEVGPLLYISKFFNIEMDSVVNILVILIVIVFDPLAVALVIAANGIKNKDTTVDEKNNFIIDEKNVILNDDEPTIEEHSNEIIQEPIQDNIMIIEEPQVQEHVTSENIYGEAHPRIVNKGKAVSII